MEVQRTGPLIPLAMAKSSEPRYSRPDICLGQHGFLSRLSNVPLFAKICENREIEFECIEVCFLLP